MTYARRLFIDVWLRDTNTNELRKSTCYLADLPVITDRGTFVINGSERVVLGQLVRAPGIYFQNTGPTSYKALILAEQGRPGHDRTQSGSQVLLKPVVLNAVLNYQNEAGYQPPIYLLAMGIDWTTIKKRLGQLLTANRIDFKEIKSNEALTIVGRAWKPDGSHGPSGGISGPKGNYEKSDAILLVQLGRKRVNNKLGMEETSGQLTCQ